MEWGSAHAVFHTELFRKLIYFFGGQIEFIKPSAWDDEDLILSVVFSPHMPPGYHGVMDIIIDGGILRFKRDADV